MPPKWAGKLLSLYWRLRACRAWDGARRRRYYRYIAQEKRRLLEDVGVDWEELRLLCRHLANLQNRHAERRWETYVEGRSKQFELPF
jgi:hypothetical protein